MDVLTFCGSSSTSSSSSSSSSMVAVGVAGVGVVEAEVRAPLQDTAVADVAFVCCLNDAN